MKAHPYADIFPMMSETEFQALCDDIAVNGLRDEIVTYHNCILDGRNRYKACKKVNATPRFKEYFGKDAIGYVLSKNLHRRHLGESQRALVAANLVSLGKSVVSPLLNGQKVQIRTELTLEQASEAMNISLRSTKDAAKVLKQGSDSVIEAVQSGELPVSKAAKIVDKPKQTQTRIIREKSDAPKAEITPEQQSSAAYKVICQLLDKLTLEKRLELIERLHELCDD